MGNVKKIVLTALYSALALIAFMLENLFPPLFIAGGRLGVSNLFILLALISLGFKEGALVLIVKCVLGSVFSGNVSAMLYSLPAGAVAFAAECCLLYFARTSLLCAGCCAGVVNALLQNVIFCIITGRSEFLAYSPYLALIGTLGGLLTGFAAFLTVKILPEKIFGATPVKEKN